MEDKIRLHMPGHKGSLSKLDITEIEGADVLYSSEGIIRKSEENAARLFGAGRTLYSTEGSSLSIRAMLYLTALYADAMGKKRLIAAGRNAHKTFVSAAALLDLEVSWLYPEGESEGIVSCRITPEGLEKYLLSMEEKPAAVYITSPDYLGNMADTRGISKVCKRQGVLLLVDNAHGAYLKFLAPFRHPITEGADMCCDSAHKTLPALTGGAYLHISENAPEMFFDMAENAMALFASTSPSYLILSSLDRINMYLDAGYSERLFSLAGMIDSLKGKLLNKGYNIIGNERLKLTIAPKSYGYTGHELSELLLSHGIVCEFSDPDYTVMMFTPENVGDDIERLEKALLSVPQKEKNNTSPPAAPRPQRVMSMKEALFSIGEELEAEKCCGRVLMSPSVSCPPAVSAVVCGERIDREVIECLHYYGIKKCRVLKEL